MQISTTQYQPDESRNTQGGNMQKVLGAQRAPSPHTEGNAQGREPVGATAGARKRGAEHPEFLLMDNSGITSHFFLLLKIIVIEQVSYRVWISLPASSHCTVYLAVSCTYYT